MLGYLDANSGSLIAAVVAGGAAGLVVLARMFGYRILGLVFKSYRRKADDERAALIGRE
jgi:hypothetical protein